MKKSLARKWASALRSGKYKQTTHTMYEEHTKSYCCLGVLCELENKRLGNYTFPEKLLKTDIIGLMSNGYTTDHTDKIPFVNLNDTKKLTFDEIADIIEIEFLEGL